MKNITSLETNIKMLGEEQVKNNIFLLVKISVIGYLINILFYGILMHIGLENAFIEKIRPFLAEAFLLLILLGWLLNGAKIKKVWILFIGYLIIVAISSILNVSTRSILLTFRDLFLPIIMLFCFSGIELKSGQLKRLMEAVRNIFAIFTIVGLIFSIIQYTLGWEWTSKFFAGYSFWGMSEDGTIRIVRGWLGFNVLGTIGNAANFGLYNGIAILIYLFYGYKKRIFNVALILLSLCNVLLSGNKTALLAVCVLIFLKLISSFHWKNRRLFFIGATFGIILLLGGTFLIYKDNNFFSSFLQRLELWEELFADENNLSNILFPHKLFYFSAGAGNSGIISFWDNSYLYLLYSIGLWGTIIFLAIIISYIKPIKKRMDNKFILYLMIYLGLSALTTCLFFGKNIMTICMIFLGIFYSSAKNMRLKNE